MERDTVISCVEFFVGLSQAAVYLAIEANRDHNSKSIENGKYRGKFFSFIVVWA